MEGRARPTDRTKERRVDAKQLHGEGDRKAFRADIFSMGAAAPQRRVSWDRGSKALAPRPAPRSAASFKKLGIWRGFGQYNYGPFEWGPEARWDDGRADKAEAGKEGSKEGAEEGAGNRL